MIEHQKHQEHLKYRGQKRVLHIWTEEPITLQKIDVLGVLGVPAFIGTACRGNILRYGDVPGVPRADLRTSGTSEKFHHVRPRGLYRT